jgi:hypothetical protein
MIWPWRRRPKAPVNVRFVVDGVDVPLDPVYRGTDQDGFHVWVVVVPAGVDLSAPFDLRADLIPARTHLALTEGEP